MRFTYISIAIVITTVISICIIIIIIIIGLTQQRGLAPRQRRLATLHDEYAERGKEYGILFIFSLFCEYSNLEYGGICVIYRV